MHQIRMKATLRQVRGTNITSPIFCRCNFGIYIWKWDLFLIIVIIIGYLRAAGSPGCWRQLLNTRSCYMWETSHVQKSSPCLALSSGRCWKWWRAGSVSMEIPLVRHWRNGWISSRYGSPNKHQQTRYVTLIAWHRHWVVILGKLYVLGKREGGILQIYSEKCSRDEILAHYSQSESCHSNFPAFRTVRTFCNVPVTI